jgi:predicted ATPase/DNA-binding SARP family transcriptional activator/Flp pilus assembly protein TadD
MENITINMFGRFEVIANGSLLKLNSDKTRAILAILVSENRPTPRERLANMVWPEALPEQARHNLRQSLYDIKASLKKAGWNPDKLHTDRDHAWIEMDGIWDGDLFAILKAGEQLAAHKNHPAEDNCLACEVARQQIIACYQGEFLGNLYIDSQPFMLWAETQQTRYRNLAKTAFTEQVAHLARALRFQEVGELLEHWMALQEIPDESLYLRQIWWLFLAGRKERALQLAEKFTDEPGVQELNKRLVEFSLASPYSLPDEHRRPFSGRGSEVQDILQSIRAGHRLITLVAPGGTGKSRLASRVAARILTEQQRYAFWIPITELQNEQALPYAIGTLLGIRFTATHPAETQLLNALKKLDVLLVFDGCEHYLDACRKLIQTILTECPRVTIIATSRESLRAPGFALHLSTLDGSALPSREFQIPPLSPLDANRLMLERLSNNEHPFSVNNHSAPLVADLCHQLGGSPLAIELAAGQAIRLGLMQVHNSLSAALQNGSGDVIPKIFQWVAGLLSSQERKFLAAASVFAGGAPLEGLGSVIGHNASDLDTVLAGMEQQYLLRNNDRRVHVHDAIREQALIVLPTTREHDNLQRKHFDFYYGLAQEQSARINTPTASVALGRLRLENDNLEKGLRYSLDSLLYDDAHILLSYLSPFWMTSGNFWSGRQWAEQVVGSPATDMARFAGLSGAGMLILAMGALEEARTTFEQALQLDVAIDPEKKLLIRQNLAIIHARQGDYKEARHVFEVVVDEARRLDKQPLLAAALLNLTNVMLSGGDTDFPRLQSAIEEALILFQKAGQPARQAIALNNLGIVLRQQNKLEEALAVYQRTLDLRTTLEDRPGMASTLSNSGILHMQLGNRNAAYRAFLQVIELLEALKLPHGVPGFLGNLARAFMLDGHWAKAAELMGASQRVFETTGTLSTRDRAERETWVEECKLNLPANEYDTCYQRGYSTEGQAGLVLARQLIESVL